MRDLSFCRPQFPSLTRLTPDGHPLIYLDGPGGSQVPSSVITAISAYYMMHNANTHGQFVTSTETDSMILTARAHMASFLGSPEPGSISFGQNMTTLNFLLSQALSDTLKPGDEIIVTDLDHDANVAPWLRLGHRGITIRRVPLRASAELDMDTFYELINERTRIVAVGWASNAVGTVNPLQEIRAATKAIGARLIVDAVHWAPHGVIDVNQLDPDFLLCSAYKFFGPHIGVLYAKSGLLETIPTLKVRPQSETGPERMETGTLNHAALSAVSAAVEFIASLADTPDAPFRQRLVQAMHHIYHYEHELATRLYRGLASMAGIKLYGPPVGAADRAPTISFTVDHMTSGVFAARLGQKGILAWDGDFYAMTLVDALHLRDKDGLVRLGLAPYNTFDEVNRTLEIIEDLLHE